MKKETWNLDLHPGLLFLDLLGVQRVAVPLFPPCMTEEIVLPHPTIMKRTPKMILCFYVQCELMYKCTC